MIVWNMCINTQYNFTNPCVGDSESGNDCEAVMQFQFGLILVRC